MPLGNVWAFPTKTLSYDLTLGAMKEIMYQVVMHGLDYPEERIVFELFRFLSAGYLRMPPA